MGERRKSFPRKPTSEETKRKISEALKGKHPSEEARKKMSIAARNKPPCSEETKEKLRVRSTGRKHTLETKQKISKLHKGEVKSKEHRRKLSEITKLKWANGFFTSLNYSKQEVRLTPVMKQLGFLATWEYSFHITYNGRTRKPDFVNTKTREIVEVFGTYWHRDRVLPNGQQHETPEEYIEWYKKAGWDCKVMWTDEFEEFCKNKERYIGK